MDAQLKPELHQTKITRLEELARTAVTSSCSNNGRERREAFLSGLLFLALQPFNQTNYQHLATVFDTRIVYI